MRRTTLLFALLLILFPIALQGAEPADGVLFAESFDDDDLEKRGWYDLAKVRIGKSAFRGAGCIEYEWTDRREQTSG